MAETNSGGDQTNTPQALEFEIQVIDPDATEEDLDEMTRNLLSELEETDVESADLVSMGAAPEGSKGDPIMIGMLAITAMPAVLPGVIDMVKGWAARGEGRTVKFKGKGIEFEGSAEELQKLLESLERQPAEKKKSTERKTGADSSDVEKAPSRNKTSGSNKIFISYRRADSADVTGRIYDRLTRHFGPAAIFKDVESIPPGVDFKEHLEQAVGKCKIFLAVIGDQWLGTTNSKQKNRLQDPKDFVRIEIEEALNRNILIIPLLVRGASMPSEDQLPPSLRKLVYRNAIPIRSDPDFHRDVDRLIAAIPNSVERKS